MGSARWGTSQKGAEERGKETAAQGMRWRERWWWGSGGLLSVTAGVGFYSGKGGKPRDSSLQADKSRGRKARLEVFTDVQVRDAGGLD